MCIHIHTHVCMCIYTYIKELSHKIMEAGKLKICRVFLRLNKLGEPIFKFRFDGSKVGGIPSYLTEGMENQFFVLIRPSAYWMRPTHKIEGNVPY